MRRPCQVLALLLVSALLLPACHETRKHVREFDGASAFHYIERQMSFGPRIPGTEPHRKMVAWLDSLLRQRADTLVVQSWTHVTAAGDSLALTNFIARFQPAASKRLLFLAHYDSRPRADSPTSTDSTQPVPSSNDGGSGVALHAPGPQPLYAVLFDLIAATDLQIFEEGNSVVGAGKVVELVWNAGKDL